MPGLKCSPGYEIPSVYPVSNQGANFDIACSPGSYVCGISVDTEQKYFYGVTATCCTLGGPSYTLDHYFSMSPMNTAQPGTSDMSFPAGLNFLQWSYTGYYMGTSTQMQTWGTLGTGSFLTMCPNGTLVTALYGSSGSTGTWLSELRGTCNSMCSACPLDYFSTSGQGRCSLCSSCPVGKFLVGCSGGSSVDGSCSPCPYNTSGGGGLSRSCSPCTRCEQGYSFSGCNGSSLVDGLCSACPTGFYGAGGYSRQCTQCPAGSYGCLGATALYSSCPPGSYCPSPVGVPLACPDGSYGCTGGATSFRSCPPGSSCPSSSAVSPTPCRQGSYQPLPNATACLACPTGTYLSGTGKTAVTDCILCLAGKYQPTTGALNSTFCVACPAGTYGPNIGAKNISMCIKCQPGFYQSVQGSISSSACVKCGVGKYQSSSGAGYSSDCVLCPPGTFQTGLGMPDIQNCVMCFNGTYQTGQGLSSNSDCLRCSAGKYQSSSGQVNCTSCQEGTYQTGTGLMSIDNCTKCRAGTYQTGIGMITSSRCLLCGLGTYQSVPGATSNQSCTACAAGTFQTRAGASSDSSCTACIPGKYQTGTGMQAQSGCILCGPGTFQNLPGQTSVDSCQPCQAGGFQTGSGFSACVDCQPGTYQPLTGIVTSDQCILCSTGTYQPISGQPTSSSCLKCRAGTYQTGLGAANPAMCSQCGSGKYQTGLGIADSSSCLACDVGTYQSSSGASSQDLCLACPFGTYQTSTGISNRSGCTQCELGTFQFHYGSTACIKCQAGKFALLRGQPFCLDCLVGTYASGLGFSTCRQCDAGQFLELEGQTVCSRCSIGKFSDHTGSGLCNSCMPGSFLNVIGASVCTLCTPGYFAGTSGASSCDACQIGQFSGGSGSSTCLACIPGKFQTIPMASTCQNCQIGYFQDFSGQSVCRMCIRAQYTSSPGMPRCSFCDRGQFQPLLAASACQNCLAGQYQANPLITYCQSCAPGTFQPTPGMGICNLCSPGQYSNVSFATMCMSCFPGQFQPLPGGTVCDSCQAGTFSLRTGSSRCSLCPPGSYQPLPESTTCLVCDRGSFLSFPGATSPDACLACGPGLYSNLTGASVCIRCSPGLYSNISGAFSCSNCSAGGYQTGFAGRSCILCAAGTFSSAAARTGSSVCVRCGAGLFSTCPGSSSCILCSPGTYQTGAGFSSCRNCTTGTYSDMPGGTSAACTPCRAGTFSPTLAAASSTSCLQCMPGSVSTVIGSKSSTTCSQCAAGKVSNPSGTACLTCQTGTYCPAGSGTQFQCVGGLLCDGKTIDAGPGFLPYFRGNCTAILPCPAGSQCSFRDAILGKGILTSAQNGTYYLVYLAGDTPNPVMTSCNTTISYGARQITSAQDYLGVADILYYLKAQDCGAGSYLSASDGTCVKCYAGTFSVVHPAYSSATCLPCPAGKIASLTGSTACSSCPAGMFSGDLGSSVCLSCTPGTFQPNASTTACLLCPAGFFSVVPGSSACLACPSGTAQPLPGSSSCISCAADQFSSAGDASCSQCGLVSTPLPSGQSCPIPAIPDNTTDVWLTVGGNETDACMGQGLSTVQNQAVGVRVVLNGTGSVCRHSLQFMTKPALTQTWSAAWTDLRRPSSVRVVLHNETFYTQSCALQGLGVLFTVSDERGFARTNLSGARVEMIVQDASSSGVYGQTLCDTMPSQDARVPFGSCSLRGICPQVPIRLAVRLTWPDGFQLQDSKLVLLGSSLCTACPAATDWVIRLDVIQPCMPFLAGDTISIRMSSQNSQTGGNFLRMGMQVQPGVQFVSFQTLSPLTVSVQNNVLLITGRYVQTADTMAVINLRLVSASSGITTVLLGSPTAEITMDTFEVRQVPIQTQGVSCRSDGTISVITDYDRPTSLLVQASKPMLVQWSALGTPVSMFPVNVSVMAVSNVVGKVLDVSWQASCVSRSAFLTITSCGSIQAARIGQGDPAVLVNVSFMNVTSSIFLSVFMPGPANVTIFNASDGMSGRFKLVSTLSAGRLVLTGIDVTPFVQPRAIGVYVQGDRWSCSVKGSFSIFGAPGVCAGQVQTAGAYQTLALYTGGSPSMGLFSFLQPVLQSRTPLGYALLFRGLAMMSITSLSSLDTARAQVNAVYQSLVLGRPGPSSACVKVSVSSGAFVFVFQVPVLFPGPFSLIASMNRNSLVVQSDSSGLLAKNASVGQAVVQYADGSSGSVLADPGLFLSADILSVSNRTLLSTGSYGLGSVTIGLGWAPCVSATTSIQVFNGAVVNSTMICPSCTSLAMPDDPLFQQYPMVFQSSIPAFSFRVRQGLADGTYSEVFEPISVSGACALQGGLVSARQPGTCTISSQSAPQGYSLAVVARLAVSGTLLCNGLDCQALNLTSPGDGASLPPFGYASSLNVSIRLIMHDQSIRHYMWLGGAFLRVNGTSKPALPVYGQMVLDLGWSSAWSLLNSSVVVRVERLSGLTISGPASIQQIHCSGIWTEAVFTAYAVLSNGDSRPVTPIYNATAPIVQHAPGRFHADWAGTGTVLATFRNVAAQAQVQAQTTGQILITGVSMAFVPAFWNVTRKQVIQIAPGFTPRQNITGWTTDWNLTRRTMLFVSSAQSAVAISSSLGTMTLLADYYQAVTISGTLMLCQTFLGSTYNASMVINVVPALPGDIDVGSETGLPVQPVQVFGQMSIPVFLYSPAPLQAFLVEISFSTVIFSGRSCTAGLFPGSDCVVYQSSDRVVFRAAGSCMGCKNSGRILIATISGTPILSGVAWMRVSLVDMVSNGTVLANLDAGILVQMGLTTPAPGTSVTTRRLFSYASLVGSESSRRSLLAATGIWGDTNGDGLFTSVDVLFLENYLASFPGSSICLGQCQNTASLSAWQLLQLCPVRDPNSKAVYPDGQQLLFIFRALLGKTVFLSKMNVVSSAGSFSLSVNFVNFQQVQNPGNVETILDITTSLNGGISFQSPSWVNPETGSLMVRLLPISSPDPLDGGLGMYTASTATLAAEQVSFRIFTRTSDFSANLPADRVFYYKPSGPLGSFAISSRRSMLRYSLVSSPALPELCQEMCEDESLFSDFTMGGIVWTGETSVQADYVLNPEIRYFHADLADAWLPTQQNQTFASNITGVYPGQAFNVTFTPLPGSSMGIYRVLGLKPARAYNAELADFSVFVQCRQSNHDVNLEFVMPPGPLSVVKIIVTPAAVLEKTLAKNVSGLPAVLEHSVQRLAPFLASTSLAVLCRYAILWSLVGGTDDACSVTVQDIWHPTGLSTTSIYLCSSYPCTFQHRNMTFSPNITTYTPVSPRIVVQKSHLVLNQKTSWKITCDLEPGLAKNVKITEHMLSQGLVEVQPANSLFVTNDWIRGVQMGEAGLFFSSLSTPITVLEGTDAPTGLAASLIVGAAATADSGTVTLSLQQGEILAGSSGQFLIHTTYSGGYQVRLDPSAHTDGVMFENVSAFLTISPIDGSCSVSVDAPYFNGVMAVVSFRGLTASVMGTILPLVPDTLSLCCGKNVTGPGSAVVGLAGYSSTFTLDNISVSFKNHGTISLDLADPRISVSFDTVLLSYADGAWSVRQLFSDVLGPTTITVNYTHPGTLARVSAGFQVNIVGVRDLVISPAGPATLKRIHCSGIFQNLSISGSLDVSGTSVDVTGDLRLFSSDPGVASIAGQVVVPSGPGSITINVFAKGFSKTLGVRILNESILVSGLDASGYSLRGHANQVLPLSAAGTYQDGSSLRDVFVLNPAVSVTGPARLANNSLVLLGNTGSVPGMITISLPACMGSAFSVPAPFTVSIMPLPGTHDILVEGVLQGQLELAVSLLGPGISAFYIELILDVPATACMPSVEFNGLFVCNTGQAGMRVTLVGASAIQISDRERLAVLNTSRPTGKISGKFEFLRDTKIVSGSIIAGSFGMPEFTEDKHGMPLVNIGTVARQYQSLLASGTSQAISDLLFNTLILAGKQRYVQPSLYSNDFELSASFRVLDRFMNPDDGSSTVFVTFYTAELPALPNSYQGQEGLVVPAQYIQDGWYAAQWRQKIPALNVSLSYFLTSPEADGDWQRTWGWNYPGTFETGRPLPDCPRGAYSDGIIEAEFLIDGTGQLVGKSRVVQALSCNLHVASRRIQLSQRPGGQLVLSVGLESFARLYQTNLVVMNNTYLASLLDQHNFSFSRILKGSVNYVNDTAEGALACPDGFYYNSSGMYSALPMHALQGIDCYDFTCTDDYEREGNLCSPVSVTSNLIWTTILIIVGIVFAVVIMILCVQLFRTKTSDDIVDFDKEEIVAKPDQDGAGARDEDELFDDQLEKVERPEIRPYPVGQVPLFPDANNTVFMDAYSAMIIEDMFSPTQREEDEK